MITAPHFRHARTLASGLVLLACQGPLEGPGEPPDAPTIQVDADGGASLEALAPVFRLHVHVDAGLVGSFTPDMFLLFSGELSSYYRGRLATAELPQTLLERRMDSLAWETPEGFDVQPTLVLPPGTYSLGLLGWGGVAELGVVDEGTPVLLRVWPPPGEGGGQGGLYCADTAVSVEHDSLELAPDGTAGLLQPNRMVPERCFELTSSGPPRQRVPPPEVDGLLVDPTPLAPLDREQPPALPLVCDPDQALLDTGCVSVEDDRLVVTPREQPQLWWLKVNERHMAFETRDGLSFVIAGLEPSSDQVMHGDVFDLGGLAERVNVEFRTPEAALHIAINEVYADANGPEPEQEWIELVNSGTLPVELQGWVLEDVGGQTELPAALIEPGAYVVLTNESYVADPDYDLLIDPLAQHLTVAALGKSGLSNSGELIRLRAPSGEIVSRFPALPAQRGRSIARREPWSLDEDVNQFGEHADPGASPGAANALAE